MHPHDPRQVRRPQAGFGLAVAILTVSALPRPAFASSRAWEPIALKGAQVAPLLGNRESQLELLAVHGGRLEPIPFQVDEVLPDGRYALPDGPEPVADDSPGVLDKDDEVVMMVSDFGARAEPNTELPRDALEIEIRDPLGGPSRFAYIASAPQPRRSALRYVEYDVAQDRVETNHYRLGFTRELPSDYSPQSRMREGGPSIIDGFKVRARTRVLGFFTFRINEGDVQNRLLAWRAGPVRVIRRLSHSVHLGLGIHSPQVTNYDFFYRDYVENPFKLRFPWVPRLLFGDIHVRLDFDFVDLAGYALSWSGMKGLPLRIGDREAERALRAERPPPKVEWVALTGCGRVLIQTIAPGSDSEMLDRRLYFHDEPDAPNPPENVTGEHPGVGYLITGWERLGAGTHQLDSMLLGAGDDYDAATLLKELRTPPAVEVRPVASGSRPRLSFGPVNQIEDFSGDGLLTELLSETGEIGGFFRCSAVRPPSRQNAPTVD